MKAVVVDRFGPASMIAVREAPEPALGNGQIRVRTCAAGVGLADLQKCRGIYPRGPRPPFVPGSELAGTVLEVNGDGRWRPGDRVVAMTGAAAHAETVVVPGHLAWRLPRTIELADAAAIPSAFLTAYHALVTIGRGQAGEWALVHAGCGGVGRAALQVARVLGLHTIATASSEGKREVLRSLDVDAVASYDDFESVCRRACGGHGPDIILDSIGGRVAERGLRLLPTFGRLVTLGMASGSGMRVDPHKLLFGTRAVLGFHLESLQSRPRAQEEAIERLFRWLGSGQLRVEIGHRFALEDARAAYALLEQRRNTGKIVLTMAA